MSRRREPNIIMASGLTLLSSNKHFGGWVKKYEHVSKECGCNMKFNVFEPPAAAAGKKVPVLWFLSGGNRRHLASNASILPFLASQGSLAPRTTFSRSLRPFGRLRNWESRSLDRTRRLGA